MQRKKRLVLLVIIIIIGISIGVNYPIQTALIFHDGESGELTAFYLYMKMILSQLPLRIRFT